MVSELLNIDVVYALPTRQTVLHLRVAATTTVLAAIELSGIVQKHPDIDVSVNKFGVYGRLVHGHDPLREGDRIEIYRPLLADPKEIRKQRAERAKEEGRADIVTGGRPNTNRKRGDNDPT
jgi:putative ubiquitin-RnfH superfamily antitoxin RatB of RatAB toxin-antitoxin module